MRIGVQFQTHEVPPDRFAVAARDAVELGVDGVFLWDHMVPFVGPPDGSAWETWTLLGAMATAVAGTGVDVGVLVSPLSFRHPQILARAAATVARVSQSRFVLGVGAGGFADDDRLFLDDRSQRERMNDFATGLRVLRSAVDDQNRRHGTDVRIWVGGDGPRVTLPAAARWADGWNGFAPVERWRVARDALASLANGRRLETSVLLTPPDGEIDVSAWKAEGADWIVRSLRPDGHGCFDLGPIRRLVADAR